MQDRITTVTNLAVAAYVIAQGIPLLRCEKISPTRCQFLFEDPNGEVKELVRKYHRDDPCPVRTFYTTLQDVRFTLNQTLGGRR